MPHITKDGKDKLGRDVWRVAVRIPSLDTPGKWVTKVKKVHGDRQEANAVARQLEEAKQQKLLKPGRTAKFGEYAEKWLADAKLRLEYSTWYSYKSKLKYILPVIGRIRLDDLTKDDVQTVMAKMNEGGLSNRSIQYAHAVMRMVLRMAVDDGILVRNVAKLVKAPKPDQGEMSFLEEREVHDLVEAAKQVRLYAPVVLGLFFGLRAGEICGLKWSDVDFRRKTISIKRAVKVENGHPPGENLVVKATKTEAGKRTIGMPAQAAKHLRQWKAIQAKDGSAGTEDWLCTNFYGGKVNPAELSRDFKDFREAHGLPDVRLHDLRHTFAFLSRRAGVDLKMIQHTMGHTSPAFTMKAYGHISDDDIRESASKLDSLLRGR